MNGSRLESRALEIRCGVKKQGDSKKVYVHMLNGTLCATERALCCIVENYQTPEVRPPPSLLSPAAFLTLGSSLSGCHHPRTPPTIHARSRVPPLRAGTSDNQREEGFEKEALELVTLSGFYFGEFLDDLFVRPDRERPPSREDHEEVFHLWPCGSLRRPGVLYRKTRGGSKS